MTGGHKCNRIGFVLLFGDLPSTAEPKIGKDASASRHLHWVCWVSESCTGSSTPFGCSPCRRRWRRAGVRCSGSCWRAAAWRGCVGRWAASRRRRTGRRRRADWGLSWPPDLGPCAIRIQTYFCIYCCGRRDVGTSCRMYGHQNLTNYFVS